MVKLFQFGQSRELVSYQTGLSTRISSMNFDPFGSRFGACDNQGNLMLWKFDSSSHALLPFKTLKTHSRSCNDFVFVNSSTVIATAGVSSSSGNVALWDTLMPPSKAKVKGMIHTFNND